MGIASEIRLIHHDIGQIFAGIFGGGSALLFVEIYAYRKAIVETAITEEIRSVEDKVRENPDKPRAAWELAQIKLESYLNRNLNQIRWIFFLILLVMLFGFVIIGYGIFQVYAKPESLNASIVAASSGVLIEFIAATFLVIYKSTMTQAQSYVSVLERINAVGMSLQILEGIEEASPELRDQAKADLAKELLTLYARTNTHDV